jgi:hypothetical protein
MKMKPSNEQKDSGDQELVQAEPENSSLSIHDVVINDHKFLIKHDDDDKGSKLSGEGDIDPVRKKTSSKTGKKSRKGSKKKTRRQSMGSIDDRKKVKRRERSRRNLVKGNSNSSFNSTSSKDSHPVGFVQSRKFQNRPSLNRNFNSMRMLPIPTQRNRSRPSSSRSLNSYSNSTHQSLRNDDDIVDRDSSQNKTFDINFLRFDDDIEADGEPNHFNKIPFEPETDVKYFDNVVLATDRDLRDAENCLVPTASSDKDSTRSGQRSSEDKRHNRDPDTKQRKSRTPQLSKTDELRRASSHSDLEGVYFNKRIESKAKKTARNESNKAGEEIQALTKMDSDGNDASTKGTSTKDKFRPRRRGSTGDKDEFVRRRSRSTGAPPPRYARAKSARDLGTRKSSERRIKRGSGENVVSPESKEAAKKLLESRRLSLDENPIITRINELKVLTKSINDSEARLPTQTENTAPENQPSSMNNTEESLATTEKVSKQLDSTTANIEKKQRRRSSAGNTMKTRLSNKSGHKSSRRSTHEKKGREKDSSAIDVNPQSDSCKKNDPSLKVRTSSIEPSSSSVEEFVSANEKEINEILNQDAKESTKNRTSNEKTTKKKKRKSTEKQRKSRGKDPSSIEADPQSDVSAKDDLTTSNIESIISSSVKEFDSEIEKDINVIPDDAEKNSSPNVLFSNSEDDSKKEVNTFSASLDSNESKEKDDNEAVEDNYLQLTFHSENYGSADDLFALMEENLNQSVGGQKETEDRNGTLRSFISIADNIDLQVSTASFSLSKSVHEIGSGYVSTDDISANGVSVDDGFANDADDDFADDIREESATKKLYLLTPMSRRKKKVSPFTLSKSLHSEDRHNDDAAEDSPPDSPHWRRRGMLNKMKTGFSESSRRTLQKASSTRNMLGQATTKALSRRKEEGQGLLMDNSEDYTFKL